MRDLLVALDLSGSMETRDFTDASGQLTDRLDAANVITWRTAHGELKTTENWLPEGAVTIGVTSGASTPDKVVDDVIDLIFATKEGQKAAVAA